ncbi:hypothetical protein [Chryseobacterium shigense]|uniref:Heme/copper-type cytochrome/quinol oxidase subunit 4 n=1 Tax=Chryseobacterium shigense TaxID=297244 RepID=A0A841NDV5_9FLAO|nr:hypothetical protein [Chryseobacterium shigense]MBB6371500.1 heme/copper-type cytochrome/quinol oxidase subunit 4 [Chryseobacterium shigense]
MGNRFLPGAGIFFLFFMLFFPLDFLGDSQKKISLFVFGNLTERISKDIFNTNNARIDFSSDSISMFVLAIVLLIISLLMALLLNRRYSRQILFFSKEIVIIYLAVVLMKYGFDKVFKTQFYLPEPNILYSRFGNLDKDILFWSTMGTSRFYSISTGILELLAALMILFRKTRVLGLLVSIGILINILFINLGFDISVKSFSLILLLMAVFALKDEWLQLYRFLVLKQKIQLEEETEPGTKVLPLWISFKTAFVGLSLAAILFPYVNDGNYNDDLVKRPFLHGAFKNRGENSDIRYIFFHRKNYMILMDKDEKMTDFHYNQGSKDQLILEDYSGRRMNVRFFYKKKDSLLTLSFGKYVINAKELNWKKMNALRPLFHIAIESRK